MALTGESADEALGGHVETLFGAFLAVSDQCGRSRRFPEKARVRQIAPENALSNDHRGECLDGVICTGTFQAVLLVQAEETIVHLVEQDVLNVHRSEERLIIEEEQLDLIGEDLVGGGQERGLLLGPTVPSGVPGQFLSCELIGDHPRWRRSAQ